MSAAPLELSVEGLAAGYGGRDVVHGLDLGPLRAGEVVALVGPNAAGKSTLLRAIAGLIPARGAVRLGGRDLLRLDRVARAAEVAFMPQTLPQGVALSVVETVIAALKASPLEGVALSGAAARDRAIATLERVGIVDLAFRTLDRLSGGQRQLAGLAQAVVRAPRLLLLDEPTSALDLRHQAEVMGLVGALAAEGRIVVAVLHDLMLAGRWADRVIVLSEGAVVAAGSPDEAITPAMLAAVYGVEARVERCSAGRLMILVDDVVAAPRAGLGAAS